jgi:hypothetical protein
MLNNPPVPTTQSPGFRVLLFGILITGILIFILALHRPPRNELANIKENTHGWWTNMAEATPKPTPKAVPTPVPHPFIVMQQPPKPIIRPTPKPISEYWLRWRRAVLTGMGGSNDSSVRELPQINGQPVATPTPNIYTTFGAYAQ